MKRYVITLSRGRKVFHRESVTLDVTDPQSVADAENAIQRVISKYRPGLLPFRKTKLRICEVGNTKSVEVICVLVCDCGYTDEIRFRCRIDNEVFKTQSTCLTLYNKHRKEKPDCEYISEIEISREEKE